MSVDILVPMVDVPSIPTTPIGGASASCADELRRSPRPSLAGLQELEKQQEDAARSSVAQLLLPEANSSNALLNFDTNAFGQSFR
jgi:hypothetical protein